MWLNFRGEREGSTAAGRPPLHQAASSSPGASVESCRRWAGVGVFTTTERLPGHRRPLHCTCMAGVIDPKMSSLRAFKEPFDRSSSEPVEDTDTTSFVAEFSLEANYPVQVTDPNDAVTLHLSSMPSGFLSPSSDRIRQPVQDVEECTCPTSTSPDHPKELQLLSSPCEKCCCPAPPPKISDLMNDKDLLDLLRLKLDPNHCTIKNWKNFASRWGMSYDELTLLEHRTQGSLSHSPTQEFLLRYNQKTVTELTELCRIYQRIDVLRLLQSWIEKDWPSRWQQAH